MKRATNTAKHPTKNTIARRGRHHFACSEPLVRTLRDLMSL